MTISPPLNTAEGLPRVLTSGVDTLELSLQVTWTGDEFLEQLRQAKAHAEADAKDCPFTVAGKDGADPWQCNVKGYGKKGHEWILESAELTLTIGNWMEPQSRPSVAARLSSEFLWRVGSFNAIRRVLVLVEFAGGVVESVKLSRADLCLDLLMPEELWSADLREQRITQADKIDLYYRNDALTGIEIGRGGEIMARLYDKPLEIMQQSHKDWMYPIWGIDAVPPGCRVIRVEFQLRGEALKDLGAKTLDDFEKSLAEVWAYLSGKWLRFADRPEARHEDRRTLPWWTVVQVGFLGVQDATPAVRVVAVNGDFRQLISQIRGLLTSYKALTCLTYQKKPPSFLDVRETILEIADELVRQGMGGATMAEDVRRKIAKFQREKVKEQEGLHKRQSHSVDSPPTGNSLEG